MSAPEFDVRDGGLNAPEPAGGGSAHWVKAVALTTLEERGKHLFRHAGRQVALFLHRGEVFACNNRCPHEGYPLREGTLDDACVLTCNWHNWKFDLRSGSNLYGGDRLRTYPVEIRDGEIWLDLADPPLAARRAEVLGSLRDAFDDNDYERMARELGRLDLLATDPADTLRAVIDWSHDRMEFGWTHAFAGMADWLVLHDELANEPEARLACLLEAVAHAADDVLREPAYPFPTSSAPYDEDAFVAAIEREDEPAAIAMVRGGLAGGLDFDAFEPGLVRAAFAHYQWFGHGVIYVTKARMLRERLGTACMEPLLLSLVRGLVFATREDLIPEFRGYAGALAAFAEAGVDAPAPPSQRPAPAPDDYAELGIGRALEHTVAHAAAAPDALHAALLGAAARHLLAFDLARQRDIYPTVSDNASWLDVSHGITFAEAVRRLCGRYPEHWPAALVQLAFFNGRNAGFTIAPSGLGPLRAAWRVDDEAAFFATAVQGIIDHECDEFIDSVHRLKTMLAARNLVRDGLEEPARGLVLAAVNRYLATPLRRKHVRRTVHQARRFVAHDG